MSKRAKKVDDNIVFKVRDKNTGLYSKGGSTPHWGRLGKVWKTAAHLSSHLTGVREWNENCDRVHADPRMRPSERHGYAKVDTSTWEVVHLRTEEVAAQPVSEYIRGRKIMKEIPRVNLEA